MDDTRQEGSRHSIVRNGSADSVWVVDDERRRVLGPGGSCHADGRVHVFGDDETSHISILEAE